MEPGPCLIRLEPESLEGILQEDPLGQIARQSSGGVSPLRIAARSAAFMFKHRKTIAKIRALDAEAQKRLDASTPEGVRASASLLGVTEDEFVRYFREALALKARHTGSVDLAAIQADGKARLEASGVQAIRELPRLLEDRPTLILFSGPQCTWCDFVKPTFARLSRYLGGTAQVFYTEDREFAASQGITLYPVLAVYGPWGRILAQAYVPSTEQFWNRTLRMIEASATAQYDWILTSRSRLVPVDDAVDAMERLGK